MKVTKTRFKGLLIIETDYYGDNRGWFTESYTKNKFAENGIDVDFVQDNHSFSGQKATLRGIHFQINPGAQTKLIRCIRGAIVDTVVDLRKGSDTYKQWYSIELSEINKKQLFIPKGFGHAFLTISDNVEVEYKVDEYYLREYDRSLKFDDPEFGIRWGINDPVLSQKDLNAPFFKDSDVNFSIKVLVTGSNGQLGHDVVARLNDLGIECIGADKHEFDITDKDQTEAYILRTKPDVIVHCAAYTAVDKAEDDHETCFDVNVNGTKYIAEACQKIDAKMVYVSSDYVFNGAGTEPRHEGEMTDPINYYGYSKEQGEVMVKAILDKFFVVRTSWLYGKNGSNFVRTMLNLGRNEAELRVVSDQVGAPTYTKDLAVFICNLLQTTHYGTYHGVNEGYCSWHEFAESIFRNAGMATIVNPISTDEYPTSAKRPLNSRLSKLMTDTKGFDRLPHWDDALARFFQELRQ